MISASCMFVLADTQVIFDNMASQFTHCPVIDYTQIYMTSKAK